MFTRINILNSTRLFAAAWLAISVFADSANAQSELVKQLSNLRTAQPNDYEAIVSEALKNEPAAADISAAIRAGNKIEPTADRAAKLVAGWSQWEATDADGVTRPYQIFIPAGIASGNEITAVIVHLHGAVGRPDFGQGLGTPDATGYAGILWPEVAEAENFLIVSPTGRDECSWWKTNGVSHVDAVIRDIRRMVNFPEDKLFAAGFSDGASGCYYLAMATPDPFAGFIAMNGHPNVASSASEQQIYLPNMAMSSTIAAMTQEDSLYPAKTVLPHITTAMQNGADILTISYPKMNHQPGYFADQSAAFVSFIKSTSYSPRERLNWQASSAELGKVQWLELLEFASPENSVAVSDSNVMSVPGRIQIGIQFDRSSPKLLVQSIESGSSAEAAKLLAGDELIEFDGQPTAGLRELRASLLKKSDGDKFSCKVKRGDSEIELSGQFPPFVAEPVYLRKNVTGLADCQIVSGESPSIIVTSKNVTKMRIWLNSDLSELKSIPVNVNGTIITPTAQQLTTKELLTRFAMNPSAATFRYRYLEFEITN